MISHPLGKEYSYQGQTWVNDTLPCGCLVAKCVSMSSSDEDIKTVEEFFNKKNVLISLIRNKIGDVSKHITCMNEVSNKLKSFITTKQKMFGLDKNVDFNGEYYYIKLKQGQNCESYIY
jgi:hypothetical protein